MRKILFGLCLLGGALSLGSSPALAQTASTVTLSTGGSCVYTGIAMLPNGSITVTCSGGGAIVPPGAPTIGSATALDASINITFTAPVSNGGAAITTYTATCTSSDGGVTNSGARVASPITVSGLTNTKLYTCAVTATNSAGTGAASAASNAVTPTAGAVATAPGAPTIGTATAGNTNIGVAFTAPASNGGAAITAYNATCTSSNGGIEGTASGAASPVWVAALTNNKNYTCTVTAVNSAGAGPSSAPSNDVMPVAPTAPGAPTGVTVTPGSGTISVAFTAPASNGGAAITAYNASCTSSDGGAAGAGSGAASPIVVSGVTSGKTYTCTVTATNSVGTGAASAASGSTQPVAGCSTPVGTTIGTLNATGAILNQTESGTILAGAVKAFPFVAPAVSYPYGIKFEIEAGYNSGAYNPKDISVSSCPGVFTGLAYPCLKTAVTANRITTGPVPTATSVCEVVPGQTYYFNVRANNPGLDAAAMINPMKR